MADLMGMMKQAQAMQAKMQALQEELDHTLVTGTAGGDVVSVTLTAKGQMKSITIDASLMRPDEKEILEDLILAAHEDARKKAEATTAEKMKSVTAGLQLPPGMKLPF